MEFWGVEVKAGEPLKVEPEDGRVVHISQAALGEGKKGNDIVPLRLKINGKMFVVGSLSGEKFPQVSFDLVLEREFELSHDWKNGSVYFCGYTAENPYEYPSHSFLFIFEYLYSESSDEDEDLPLPVGITGNGTIEAKVDAPTASKPKAAKPESSAKPKVTVVEPEEDDDSDEDDSDDDSDDSDDEDMMDDVEDKDDSEEEDEETPKKVEAKAGPSKKRPTESATKTPVPSKKVKLDTPQKTEEGIPLSGQDGKKGGGHTATPHPSKKTGKSPAANSNKAKEQTPKSEGKVSCKTCNRTFNSDNALESHSKAKHGST
ncbi:hypothetical protein RHGRI_002225 [Rhododendron griersonianum]|uniref:C2H2-type domain-containing protein n=1 Tax=Rhododendron griersonianum TaxID=479676 RepID=A0AAV6LPB9_9ERIC|nr:hypothetical protein RHGRI_002225 [Rhododendron griersonianum]